MFYLSRFVSLLYVIVLKSILYVYIKYVYKYHESQQSHFSDILESLSYTCVLIHVKH